MTELRNHVRKNLRYKIIMHHLKPGEVLREAELMKEYGIGRTPLREIIIDLEREGLIQRFPRSGTIVAPMDWNELKEITQIRIPLEGLVGELAADKISRQQVAALHKAHDAIVQLSQNGEGTDEDIVTYDTMLHNILYEATGNARLHDMLRRLQTLGSRYWFTIKFSRQQYLDEVAQWGAIIDAVERGDKVRSRELLQLHLRQFINSISENAAAELM